MGLLDILKIKKEKSEQPLPPPDVSAMARMGAVVPKQYKKETVTSQGSSSISNRIQHLGEQIQMQEGSISENVPTPETSFVAASTADIDEDAVAAALQTMQEQDPQALMPQQRGQDISPHERGTNTRAGMLSFVQQGEGSAPPAQTVSMEASKAHMIHNPNIPPTTPPVPLETNLLPEEMQSERQPHNTFTQGLDSMDTVPLHSDVLVQTDDAPVENERNSMDKVIQEIPLSTEEASEGADTDAQMQQTLEADIQDNNSLESSQDTSLPSMQEGAVSQPQSPIMDLSAIRETMEAIHQQEEQHGSPAGMSTPAVAVEPIITHPESTDIPQNDIIPHAPVLNLVNEVPIARQDTVIPPETDNIEHETPQTHVPPLARGNDRQEYVSAPASQEDAQSVSSNVPHITEREKELVSRLHKEDEVPLKDEGTLDHTPEEQTDTPRQELKLAVQDLVARVARNNKEHYTQQVSPEKVSRNIPPLPARVLVDGATIQEVVKMADATSLLRELVYKASEELPQDAEKMIAEALEGGSASTTDIARMLIATHDSKQPSSTQKVV